MRCAGRIQGEKLAAECGRRWDEHYTSHANHAGCVQPCTQAFMVERSRRKAELVDFHHLFW